MAAPIAERRRRPGRLAERAVERRAVLRRVGHDRHLDRIPRASSAARIAPTRPSIMSDGATMCAPASACETRRLHQPFDRRVVEDALAVEQAAVAVRRVFAEADVGDDEQTGQLAHQCRGPRAARRLVVPRGRALVVLVLGQAEQQHAGDAVGRAPRQLLAPPRPPRAGRRRASTDIRGGRLPLADEER